MGTALQVFAWIQGSSPRRLAPAKAGGTNHAKTPLFVSLRAQRGNLPIAVDFQLSTDNREPTTAFLIRIPQSAFRNLVTLDLDPGPQSGVPPLPSSSPFPLQTSNFKLRTSFPCPFPPIHSEKGPDSFSRSLWVRGLTPLEEPLACLARGPIQTIAQELPQAVVGRARPQCGFPPAL